MLELMTLGTHMGFQAAIIHHAHGASGQQNTAAFRGKGANGLQARSTMKRSPSDVIALVVPYGIEGRKSAQRPRIVFKSARSVIK